MAIVIHLQDLKPRSTAPAQRPAQAGPAQIVLFTGVRYERTGEHAAKPHTRRAGGRKSAQASAQE